jgi:hypothetical protein
VQFSFTLGNVIVPKQTVTHGSLVYLQGSESAVQSGPYWRVQSDLDYERSDVYYSGDTDATTPGSGLYWTIKHVDASLTAIGQPVHFGDLIYLENRFIPSLGDWLPGKLIPSPPEIDSTIYLALTDDPDYENTVVGKWQLYPVTL